MSARQLIAIEARVWRLNDGLTTTATGKQTSGRANNKQTGLNLAW